MADPRFYDNRGPFTLKDICARIGAALPQDVDMAAIVEDVASLSGAGATHLSFYTGKGAASELSGTMAGFCLVPAALRKADEAPANVVVIPCASVQHAFSTVAEMFYPDANRIAWAQQTAVDPRAEIGEGVVLGHGVVIGAYAQVGDGTYIGPNSVIGRGVAIGRGTEIGSNVSISHAYVGDQVLILPGAQIGQPGFGFASSAQGHVKTPQLGRVIVQDKVEIGACVTIDRGALGDTVIGEGTKIDNLVQIGHNVHLGRHCVIVGQAGIAGSSTLGDFVVMGAQAGVSDHARVGNGARIAGRAAVIPGQDLEGGHDYGGVPAKPAKIWMRELHAVAALVKRPKRDGSHD
ncbi:MAG: UDP-3-O-(3-hydroxymyristoyl)glucosamine N-acyltransferase [Alphaproteobacteria bacterium]|nr:UDP-3-O-(3-hydroxymyristoyl)glucosamine N-acyltransferase [Alphaproteobacteria bacterium]MDE1986857.1 UDP-3-O-(3-hydroxymyristoyl)glucosamine N-acyltransferase [Alphaproteobacteria bacterium]MDE2163550.1 UDP-3-O-(3-hydroxymyristoyl)glucosamine N-acyltransferase [Alphaproteobacteria bacterium]MDE2266531.1 UDP-3-O-(3-hydroxymyristoyl)glucosamine N-acyltransferase [Alphaproteobacteria bacterium]MDE2500183.1 UDP-3-O-(3-hydroxymyristoyl)glucosamine N-acyltransferase [Alphaproteobacteria bacterium